MMLIDALPSGMKESFESLARKYNLGPFTKCDRRRMMLAGAQGWRCRLP